MDSIQISIAVPEEKQDILIAELSELSATGFEQFHDRLLAYFNEDDFNSYDVSALLQEYEFVITTIKEKNWNEEWEQNFEPVVVGDFCSVRAHFHPAQNVLYDIIITPKMSFGTGHHATTYMMIQQMEKMDFKNKTVFDFGTGTGVLAILAEKLGASQVDAIDVDDWSIENAIENAERNKCTKISLKLSSNIPEKKFDIILANINRNVILQYLAVIKKSVEKNGMLLLSGLLTTDRNDIVAACNNEGFELKVELEKNNWISLLFVNKN